MNQATSTGVALLPLHGGKDGIPYPVNRQNYDRSIEVLGRAVRKAKMGQREEIEALRRLHSAFP